MQSHSALTFPFPSTHWICYFISSPSVWEGFALALGGLLLSLSPLYTMPLQRVSEMAGKLRCIMLGILVAQFSQLTFQKVLNIHVFPHGHLTLVTQSLQLFSQYPFKLLLTLGALQQ